MYILVNVEVHHRERRLCGTKELFCPQGIIGDPGEKGHAQDVEVTHTGIYP